MNNELTTELERLVDQNTLASVIAALCCVCIEKAEHLEINWQDKTQAKVWLLAEKKLTKIANELDI